MHSGRKNYYNSDSGVDYYSTNNVAVVGLAGGTGRLVQTGGAITNNLRMFVGGMVTNEFSSYVKYSEIRGRFLPDYGTKGYGDRHGANGYVGVMGGTFYSLFPITVGQDGVGVFEVGPTGTVEAAALVLTNNAYTAAGQSAATLKFTFGEEGVGKATVGSLVVGEDSKLVVDLGTYNGAHPKVKLVEAGAVEGAFAAENIELTYAEGYSRLAAARIEQSASGLSVVVPCGTTIIIR